MFEIIGQIFLEVLLGAPGAIIIWIFQGRKGSYSEILAHQQSKSAIVGFIFWVIIAVIGMSLAKAIS